MTYRLTDTEHAFVRCLLGGMTPRAAYMRTFNVVRCTKARIDALYARVSPYLEREKEKLMQEAIMTREEALVRLSHVARAKLTDVADFDDEEVRVRYAAELSETARAALCKVKQGKYGVEIELYNPLTAIKTLAEMQGWEAPKKTEVTVTDELSEEQLEEALAQFGLRAVDNQLDGKLDEEQDSPAAGAEAGA